MFRNVASVALVVVGLTFATGVSAQSQAELQAQLQALLAQVAALQQILAQTQGGSTPPIVTGGGANCPSLYRNLRQGMSGPDVSSLQQFLYSEGSLTSLPTGYFGTLTEAAVQKFQARNGIVSSGTPDTTGFGAVGPGTRAAIARVCVQVQPPLLPPIYPPYPPSQQSCILNGVTIPHGGSQVFYSASTVPAGQSCISTVRVCTNGILSGGNSYVYPTCSQTQARTCYVDGTTIPEGVTQTYYSRRSVPYNERCQSYAQQRSCTNGFLSGSSIYNYLDCDVDEAEDCIVQGERVAHGTSRTFYSQTTVPFASSCSSYALQRTCTHGTLNGSNSYTSLTCTPAISASCTLDGVTVANNASRDFYNTETVPYGQVCTSRKLSRTCTQGILSGDNSYNKATCSVAGPGACTLDGATVAHGASRTFYSSATVPHGQVCTSIALSRSCNNGVLSGNASYQHASCTVSAPASCTLDGATVAHGASRMFYTGTTVPFGQVCTSIGLNRSCTNGVLSGNVAYNKANCAVGNAPAPTCALETINSAYRPNQQVGFKWTTQNATGGTLLGIAIPSANLASGSRANAIAYSSVGEKQVVMNVTGNLNTTGQCTATVKIQNVLPPTCTLTAKRGTTNYGSSITVNYADTIQLEWTSSGATDYASSTSLIGPGATTSLNVGSGSITFQPRAASYTYTFNNAGGSTSCTVNVTHNAPTCAMPTSDKASYVYGDPVTLTYSSTNADYVTATSTSRLSPQGSVAFTNVTDTTTYTFTFRGLGGQSSCSRTITIPKPMTMTAPSGGTYQKGNDITATWQYPGAPTTAGVYLILTDTEGNKIGTSHIASQQLTTGSYGWTLPEVLGSTTLTSGQYKIRAVAYTPKGACTNSGCGTHTVLARADSGTITISTTASLQSQLASALSALQSLLSLLRGAVQ